MLLIEAIQYSTARKLRKFEIILFLYYTTYNIKAFITSNNGLRLLELIRIATFSHHIYQILLMRKL